MSKAKVFFSDFSLHGEDTVISKFTRLLKKAGIDRIDFSGKLVAIKTHFGEPGNMAYLRPNYARAVAGMVKELGGKPFLTDANTLYVGGRKNAVDHLESASWNGYNAETAGCPVIIADGLKGLDDVEVPVNGEYISKALIARAVMDADVFISLSHFKGHELTGIGGAIKNIGMGSGSRAGKMAMHSSGKPSVDKDRCIGCGACARICAHDAPRINGGKAEIDHGKCTGCGRCIAVCPRDAVTPLFNEADTALHMKIAEYAAAVLNGRPAFHISVICDITPNCDCHADNLPAIIPDVGMAAASDPVALDQACAELCLAKPPAPGGGLEGHEGEDYFTLAHENTFWRHCTEAGERAGIGTRNYELVTVR